MRFPALLQQVKHSISIGYYFQRGSNGSPFFILSQMKREDLAQKLARKTGLSPSEARNEVDELVDSILNKLRKGQPVKVPGVGKLLGAKREK